jgi:hypothetical protein
VSQTQTTHLDVSSLFGAVIALGTIQNAIDWADTLLSIGVLTYNNCHLAGISGVMSQASARFLSAFDANRRLSVR